MRLFGETPLPVTIDISPAANVPAGLGRYTRSLVEAMLPHAAQGDLQFFYNHIEGRSQIPAMLADLPMKSVKLGYKPWRMAVWLGQLLDGSFSPWMPPDTDLLHATEHLLVPMWDVPKIMTVHDLIFKLYPEHHKRMNYWYLNVAMPLYVKKADAIIAISENTKRDLITHYGTPSEKITVIYEAATPNFKPQTPESVMAVRQKFKLPNAYVVVVGTIEPRKNYTRLLRAMHIARKQFPAIELVVVGSKGWLFEPFMAEIKALNAEKWVHFPGFVPDEDLPAVYSGAAVMAMPSLYEGFGLPLLEAMACGVPVVSSNAASLPELGGDAVAYFDPTDENAIARTLRDVLGSDARQQMMKAAGLRQAAQFSWDRAAQETLALYEQVLNY